MSTFSSLLIDYLGEGLASARPTTLNLVPGMVGFYYATDTKTLSIWQGSGWDVVATAGTARNTAKLQAQWVSGATVANDTVYLAFSVPYAGTINSLDYFTGVGSFAVSIYINGSVVTGLAALAVNNTAPANAAATAANTFSAGAKITAVITAVAGSPTDALLNLNITWS